MREVLFNPSKLLSIMLTFLTACLEYFPATTLVLSFSKVALVWLITAPVPPNPKLTKSFSVKSPLTIFVSEDSK